jgi:hypothetical protein
MFFMAAGCSSFLRLKGVYPPRAVKARSFRTLAAVWEVWRRLASSRVSQRFVFSVSLQIQASERDGIKATAPLSAVLFHCAGPCGARWRWDM